jgi:hypothetical protein
MTVMNSFRREALMDGRRRLVDLSEYLMVYWTLWLRRCNGGLLWQTWLSVNFLHELIRAR